LTPGDYLVVFTATAANTSDTCSAQQTFHIDANQTHTVTVTLVCGTTAAAPGLGNEIINGQVVAAVQCPYLQKIVIAPLQVSVGDTIDLSTSTSDMTGTLAWTATPDGTIDTPAAATAKYTCTSAGTKHIQVELSKAPSCSDIIAADVVCVGGGGGTGGAG